jgi:CheY-like chemotaxis protein
MLAASSMLLAATNVSIPYERRSPPTGRAVRECTGRCDRRASLAGQSRERALGSLRIAGARRWNARFLDTCRNSRPMIDETAVGNSGARRAAPPQLTILLVDDQSLLRSALRRTLVSFGHRVLEASSAAEAERIAAAHDGPIDLLLSDVLMPGCSGAELAERLKPRRSEIRVVLMSGLPADVLVSQGRIRSGDATLEKPFNQAALARAIEQAIERPRDGGG